MAAAAAPVTVQASAHANSKYAMPPAYAVDPPIPAGSLSKAPQDHQRFFTEVSADRPHHDSCFSSLKHAQAMYMSSLKQWVSPHGRIPYKTLCIPSLS